MKADPFPLVVLLIFICAVAGLAGLFPLAHASGHGAGHKPDATTDRGTAGSLHSTIR
jgi:hypothetical protein